MVLTTQIFIYTLNWVVDFLYIYIFIYILRLPTNNNKNIREIMDYKK